MRPPSFFAFTHPLRERRLAETPIGSRRTNDHPLPPAPPGPKEPCHVGLPFPPPFLISPGPEHRPCAENKREDARSEAVTGLTEGALRIGGLYAGVWNPVDVSGSALGQLSPATRSNLAPREPLRGFTREEDILRAACVSNPLGIQSAQTSSKDRFAAISQTLLFSCIDASSPADKSPIPRNLLTTTSPPHSPPVSHHPIWPTHQARSTSIPSSTDC